MIRFEPADAKLVAVNKKKVLWKFCGWQTVDISGIQSTKYTHSSKNEAYEKCAPSSLAALTNRTMLCEMMYAPRNAVSFSSYKLYFLTTAGLSQTGAPAGGGQQEVGRLSWQEAGCRPYQSDARGAVWQCEYDNGLAALHVKWSGERMETNKMSREQRVCVTSRTTKHAPCLL